MPDDISQATPEEPITPETEAGVQSPEEGSEPDQPQTEKPLTLADLEEWQKRKVEPFVQSQVAKGENRIVAQMNTRIQERFAALEKNRSALDLSDDQVAAAQRKIIEEEQMNAFSPGKSGPDPDNPAPSEPEFEAQFVGGIQEIFQSHGVDVTMQDPEWKEHVEAEWNNPKGNPARTYAALGKAAAAKAKRLSSLKASAPARVVNGGGTQTNQPKPKTAEEKISAGLKNTKWSSNTPQK